MMRNFSLLMGLAAMLAGCPEPVPEGVPEEPLQAGVARVRFPAPLGIGTAGFNGMGVPSDKSPYSEIFPSTKYIHGHPDIKAVVLSRGGPHEMIFLRIDGVGVFQQMRTAVVNEVQQRLGIDIDDQLIIGATHSHSGPGRVIDGGGIFDLIADRFFPEYYERLVSAMADAIELAYDDLAPARVGTAAADAPDAHNDRRCEDDVEEGGYKNSTARYLAIEREGQVDALILSFALHGTSLGIDDLHLSQDVSGGVESQIADQFEHPVEVLMFNAWGADMSPANPDVADEPGSPLPDGYTQMEAVGWTVAQAVKASLPEIEWMQDPTIYSELHRVPIGLEAIGYDDVFTYEYGGVYCTFEVEDCDVSTTNDKIGGCVPFSEDNPAPAQTEISAGRIGDLSIVTFPGEPGTLLAEAVMEELRAENPEVGDVWFFGYAQDYLGYSLLEEDFWQGGYEASGALWGPLQGEYLKSRVVEIYGRTFSPGGIDSITEPPPAPAFEVGEYVPVTPQPPLELGQAQVQPAASVGATDVVTFVVAGSDPWFGAPLAVLLDENDEVVTRLGGKPLDSDGYGMWVELNVEPPYKEEATERKYLWSFSVPVTHAVPGLPDLDGTYRFRVRLPTASGEPVESISSAFTVAR